MLRFAVHDEHGPALQWPLDQIALYDQEDVVVAGDVQFKNGCIECRRSGSRAVGLGLLFDTGACGKLALQTCLLPDRDTPYQLTVELARHRIAIFLAKCEEWQMLDLSEEHPAMVLWESARQLLTRALVAGDALVADAHAREALVKAIEASERLAMAHAEILLHRRYQTKPASSATFGVRLHPSKHSGALEELLQKQFDLISMPMRWSVLAPSKGVYDWKQTDTWMGWAQDNNIKIVAGPLIDLNPGALPGWVEAVAADPERVSDLAYEHVEQIVHRYGDLIGMFCTTSGINTNTTCRMNRRQMIALERSLAVLVRQGKRGRRVMIEISQPFGEYMYKDESAVPPFIYLEQLSQEGIRLDAIGLRLLLGEATRGMATRDLMQIGCLLDRFFLLERPVLLTNVGVPSEQVDPGGGWWHSPWSDTNQAKWASRLVHLALSRPYIESIFWTDLFDHEDTTPSSGGLLSVRGKPKPVLQKILSIRKRLQTPLGPLSLPRKGGSASD
jgi:hypothetical protein